MIVYDAQKDIYTIFSSSTIKLYKISVIKLYKLKFFTQCFDCASARKKIKITSDTHESYFGNITEYNISEICIRVTRP